MHTTVAGEFGDLAVRKDHDRLDCNWIGCRTEGRAQDR